MRVVRGRADQEQYWVVPTSPSRVPRARPLQGPSVSSATTVRGNERALTREDPLLRIQALAPAAGQRAPGLIGTRPLTKDFL
jgi:hypothetical protein